MTFEGKAHWEISENKSCNGVDVAKWRLMLLEGEERRVVDCLWTLLHYVLFVWENNPAEMHFTGVNYDIGRG